MKVKYKRTSTMEQHGKRFGLDTEHYDHILFDRGISGTKPFRERAGSMNIITNVIVTIQSLGNLRSIIDGKKNPLWTLVSSIMSSLYQMELENLKLRTHMVRQSYLLKGGKLGRRMGSNENETSFMNKPKSQEIVSLLRRGKSTRDIVGR